MIGNHISIQNIFWQSLQPKADVTSLKGPLIHTFFFLHKPHHMHTDTQTPAAWIGCNRLLIFFFFNNLG